MKNISQSISDRKPRKSMVFLIIFLMCVAAVLTGTAVAQDDDEPADNFPIEHPDFPGVMILNQEQVGRSVETTITIPVQKDAYISSGFANSNFGNSTTLNNGFQSSGGLNAMRMILQFDLASIPSNAHIDNATFDIYQIQTVPAGDSDYCMEAQYMRASWVEGSITWNNANYLGGTVIGVGCLNNVLGWKSLNATNVVNSWHSGAQVNYGAILTGDERPEVNRSRIFYSREQPGDTFPRLVVTYNQQCDNIPPTSNVHPLNQWSPASFPVSWSGSDTAPSGCPASGINHYDIDYRINGGTWIRWKSTSDTSGTFSAASNGNFVEFRSRATDNAGNVSAWSGTQASTTVDSIPPTANTQVLPEYSPPFGTISWTGSDNLSGIRSYDVQFRFNYGPWQNLVLNAPPSQTSYNYTGAAAGFYEIRTRATDNAGNVMPWSGPQASTTVVDEPASFLSVTPNIIKPSTVPTQTFTIQWDAFTLPPATIQRVDLYYKFGNSNWIQFDTSTSASGSTQFNWTTANPGGTDGLYYFTAIATDSLMQQETLGDPKASGIVDMADEIQPIKYLPLIFRDTN